MVKKILVGGLAAGILLFIWQGVFWAVLPPVKSIWNGFPDGEQLMGEMKSRSMESGVYYFPEHPDAELPESEQTEAWSQLDQLARTGPTVTFAVYQADGYVPTAPGPFVKGVVLDIIAALVMTFVIGLMAVRLKGYGQRVLMCAALGSIGILAGPMVFGSFYLFPTPLIICFLVDAIVGWMLAGLLIAWATMPSISRAETEAA